MTWELLSPLTIALAAVTIVALERAFPYGPRQALFRRGAILHRLSSVALAQSYVLGLVIERGNPRCFDRGTGLSRLHVVSGWPVVGQVAVFWISHDLYIYWFHRTQHRNRWHYGVHENASPLRQGRRLALRIPIARRRRS